MTDPLIDALKSQWASQPVKPQYETGTAAHHDRSIHLGVDRVATPDEPWGLECGRTLTGRRYLITMPRHIAVWAVASLGVLLSDDEWEEACAQREAELADRALDEEEPT